MTIAKTWFRCSATKEDCGIAGGMKNPA